MYFAEDECEVFQVKKSSHSKKVMRKLDKERRKKSTTKSNIDEDSSEVGSFETNGKSIKNDPSSSGQSYSSSSTITNSNSIEIKKSTSKVESKNKINTDSRTEIRTDDFVVRLLLSIFSIQYKI